MFAVKSNCESCAHFVYDDESECYTCEVNLDEDEMARFIQGSVFDCNFTALTMNTP